MNKVMVSLIGEQPLPNLLPIRHEQPKEVLLAYTRETEDVGKRLQEVLERHAHIHLLEVRPFNIEATGRLLRDYIIGRGWKPEQLVFNLTGGTKAMSIAAYKLAETGRSQFLYLQSEGAKNLLYRYRFDKNGEIAPDGEDDIPGVISLDDYLRIHLRKYSLRAFPAGDGGRFEKIIFEALEKSVDEILHGVNYVGGFDIDIVLRCGNQVGIAEVKSGKQALDSHGIKQLNLAGRREFLGIYTKKFLIQSEIWGATYNGYREFAKQSEITVIELPSYKRDGDLSSDDRQRLVKDVLTVLGG
ncbi:MAG: DUF1887 domain-containing protein [bacterium]